jgi:hypothetical protein
MKPTIRLRSFSAVLCCAASAQSQPPARRGAGIGQFEHLEHDGDGKLTPDQMPGRAASKAAIPCAAGRRDALLVEDRSRRRNATLLANLALLRNVLLEVMAPELEHQSLPPLRERLPCRPAHGLQLLARS